uniref:Plexin b2b n=1 Tax=Oryzias sinensis TaxID=183150 RepID=A0A8C7ZYD7_9TELE
MACWVSFLLFFFCQSTSHADPIKEFPTKTLINNVVQDRQTGRIYLGAVNNIFQLGPSLQFEASAETGPKEDSPTCTPPASSCHDTSPMPNTNKLLLVNQKNGSLIVCGSRYRGICSLRDLSNVGKELYYTDNKGEKTYVASIEDDVNVVGIMSNHTKDQTTFDVFFVGKGYGSQDSAILISTRILQDFQDWVVFESISEPAVVQTKSYAPKFMHDFRFAFEEGGFIYFLFSRTFDGTDNKILTFVSRLCKNDSYYYSHTELQLNCGTNNQYNKVQAAFVGSPGKYLAQELIDKNIIGNRDAMSKVLFMVASSDDDKSALCMYPLSSINGRLMEIISACYSDSGKISNKPAKDMLDQYKCGADFLPSPLASRPEFAFKADPVWETQGFLTAVAIDVENDHTVGFLGNNQGEVFKVHLAKKAEHYGTIPGDGMRENVNRNLFFDLSHNHIYITTERKITKVPVQTCLQKTDCQSCMDLKDPYCGWCVLEGRCTRRSECKRAEEKNGWLWSPAQQCVKIASFSPPNFSREKRGSSVRIYNCYCFLSYFVSLLYCCVLRCMSCVASAWECQWNILDHTCNDRNDAVTGPHIIRHREISHFISIKEELRGSWQVIFRNFLFLCFVHLSVTLYNCAKGREDCSLCKYADSKYKCVWCRKQNKCVFEKLCGTHQDEDLQNVQCPNPEITDVKPLYGPLNGSISITIFGSNLGIHKEDIKSITVAGEPCIHQKEKYSVSKSMSVPSRGPKAGGTLITISGKFLETGSKVDVQVTIGGVHCAVEQFGEEITCRTGEYKGEKVPSEDLPITLKYGKSTSRTIQKAFKFLENPTVLDHTPKSSFVWLVEHKLHQFCPVMVLKIYSLACFPALPMCLFVVSFKNFNQNTPNILVSLSMQGRGFSKAMTVKETKAFVGDVKYDVTVLRDDNLFLVPPDKESQTFIKFGKAEFKAGSVQYERKNDLSLYIIIPAVIVPMLLIITISVYCYRRKSQQAEREYEKVKHQLENLEESVRDRCKKEFTDLMIEMEDHTNDLNEGGIPFLDYKTYTDRVFFLPSKDGANDVMITGKLDIPEARKNTVNAALNQFSNLLNSKTFLINFIRTLERSHDFNARARVYCASLLTVALHGKLEYYTDIMRTLLLELMEEYVHSKNPKLMLRRSETVVERMLCNWMSICLYQFLKDSAGEPLYKLFRAIKHQIEKGPVDARVKKAKYTLNDTGLLGDDVEYSNLQVLVQGEGLDVTYVKVLNCDTISQVKEKIIEQVYRNLPYSQRPKADGVTLEWRPGSTGQILSDLDLTSQKEGRWRRINTLAHYNVISIVLFYFPPIGNALLEDDKVFHLVRPAEELDEFKSKRGSIKDKSMTKAITEIYLTRLLSVKGTLQQFVDNFFRSVLCSGAVVPPAVKYFFDFLDEQALKHNNVDEETIHIWKTNSLPLRFWVNILKNPHFIFDVHVSEVVDASLSVIAQTFMDACTKSEHKLSRDSPSNKLLYAKEISTYKKMVDDYYKDIRLMVPVSDQDMNTHLAEVSRSHTSKLNTQVALHQLYQYASKYYDEIIKSLEEDPAARSKNLTTRLNQIAAALENKVTDL